MNTAPIFLRGQQVILEPLKLKHLDDLAVAGRDEDIWRFLPSPPALTREAMQSWIEAKLAERTSGMAYPFAILRADSGRAIGSTSYLEMLPHHNRLEIGSTWLGAEARRTRVNTECKFLLLTYAFDTFGANRVQLKTDSRNLVSQRAIERLGATKEGVLRAHMVMPDGYVRDTVMYSIIRSEWPAVRDRLQRLLARE